MRGCRTRVGFRAAFVAVLSASVLGFGASGATASRPTLFDYDRSAPLGLVQGKATTAGGIVRQILTFNGAGSDRLAAAGFSYGAEITGTLAGLEHRLIGVFAFKSGRGHNTGFAQSFCRAFRDPKVFAAYLSEVGPLDPVHSLPAAVHASVLVQNGTHDNLTPKTDVLALYAAAKGKKELHWYDAGHDLNAEAAAYRQQWLLRQLTGH